jgi:hypothetical protein
MAKQVVLILSGKGRRNNFRSDVILSLRLKEKNPFPISETRINWEMVISTAFGQYGEQQQKGKSVSGRGGLLRLPVQ